MNAQNETNQTNVTVVYPTCPREICVNVFGTGLPYRYLPPRQFYLTEGYSCKFESLEGSTLETSYYQIVCRLPYNFTGENETVYPVVESVMKSVDWNKIPQLEKERDIEKMWKGIFATLGAIGTATFAMLYIKESDLLERFTD